MSTRFSQYKVLLTHEPASFWRENMVAVVTMRRVLARMSKWREQVIKCEKFYHFAMGRGETSFTKGNSDNFSSEKTSSPISYSYSRLRP